MASKDRDRRRPLSQRPLSQDELDRIEGEKGLNEYLEDPSASISLEDYMAKRKARGSKAEELR